MLKRFVCACIPMLLLPLFFLSQASAQAPAASPSSGPAQRTGAFTTGRITGPIQGREWPEIKFTFDQGLAYTQVGGKTYLLDLYTPHPGSLATPNPPGFVYPVIVWIHGETGPFTDRYPSPIASMVGNGYAVASISYPNSVEASIAQQLDDCRAAIRWLRANAAQYGLDANHIGAWGIGEGGRLAALLATPAGLKEGDTSGSVQAVVDFSGPVSDKGLNPVTFASKDNAPIIISNGDAGKAVPLRQTQALDAALRKAGANSKLVVVKGAGNDFKQLRQGDGVEQVNNFLDENLNGGTHTRYWLGKIDPPADAWVDPIVDEPVGTRYVTFAAPSLGPGRVASYLLYLPPGYDKSPAKRYPVLYYFHGAGGSQLVGDIWVQKLDAAIKKGICPPMIAVLVEGLPGGSYLDSPDGKTPIESVIIKDLIPSVDANYRTIPRREAPPPSKACLWADTACSISASSILKCSASFPACAPASPIPMPPREGTPPRTQSAYTLANNPFVLAETNLAAIKGRSKIRSVVGTDDMTLDANKAFDARLTTLGIPHTFTIVPHVSHGYKEYYQILDFSFFKTIATM